MPRRTQQSFRCSALQDLTRQLLFAPAEKRREHVLRAERLHDSLEPTGVYPQDYVIYRVTGIAAVSPSEDLLVGEALLPDLRLLIDQLSHSVEMTYGDSDLANETDATATMSSARELADRFHVTIKTITRWRKLGLRWRWVISPGSGKREVRYPEDGVEHFLKHHADRVSRAASFTQLDATARGEVLELARELVGAEPMSMNQAATRLAERTGRATETIRLLLQRHDREHPDRALFAEQDGPLSVERKAAIAEAFAQGVSVSKLAKLHGRGRSTIYRAIHERRAADLRRRAIHYVHAPIFDRDDADEVLLRPLGESEAVPTKSSGDEPVGNGRGAAGIGGLPEPLRAFFDRERLPANTEHALWVRLHYLQHKADLLRKALDPYDPRVSDMDEIDGMLAAADAVRDRLAGSHLPTLFAVAKAHLVDLPVEHRSDHHLMKLLETGFEVLVDAVHEHDPWGKQKDFERDLSWRLMRRFANAAANDDASRATRRVDPKTVLNRMTKHAAERGVMLV